MNPFTYHTPETQQEVLALLHEHGDEAKLIAQNTMMESRYNSSYDVLAPELINTDATAPYPNFWFVSFPAQDESSTYGHVVVVDKLTGGVIRSSDYKPAVQGNFDWLIKQK